MRNYLFVFSHNIYLLITAKTFSVAYGEALVQSLNYGPITDYHILTQIIAK